MDYHIWLAYVVTAVVFSLAPGSGTVNSISNGLNYGTQKSLMAIVGLQLGLTFHIVLVGAGIGAIVAKSALAFSIIKWIGVCYLVWLGIVKLRDRSALIAELCEQQTSKVAMLRTAFIINLTNPKSIVFLVALFPQFIDPKDDQITQLIILGATTLIIDGMVMLGYTSLAAQLGRYIRSQKAMARINKLFGSMFVGCAALLATAKT